MESAKPRVSWATVRPLVRGSVIYSVLAAIYANVMSAGPKGSVTILRERVTFLILGVQEVLITDRVRGGRLLLTVIRLRA